eukprot:TRINITY_DN11136_c0_g1_i1.p1 TRINITY_DN11136_c0_g1~~TRINITY_DN11136_c0_g1_i1.p1  ORF type:complete len:318 (-),score=42.74 TRINITY_DN11136_c0_g1_i1:118-1071(-)
MRDLKEIAKLTRSMKSLLNKPSPVIGILTKSARDEGAFLKGYREIIEPKYLHILRDALVLPISLYASRSEMEETMRKTNGLCLPGGFSNIWRVEEGKKAESDYAKAGNALLELAVEANRKGVYFPVLGICLGFELMVSYVAKDFSLIEPCTNCNDYNAILKFTEEGKDSRLYRKCFNERQIENLQAKSLSYNYHSFMIDPERFLAHEKLSKFFSIISTSPSINNSFEFVSTIEAKEFPFYAFQHHPEWSFYDYYNPKLNVICDNETKDIGNAIRLFFLKESKKNNNVYADKEELEKRLIVNQKLHKAEIKGYTYFLP